MAENSNRPNRSQAHAIAARELRRFSRRGAILITAIVVVLLLGAAGYAISEGSGFWYAFRWSLDTAATVGGFPQPASTAGQIFQVALIMLGVGALFYALATVAELFAGGQLTVYLAARRSERMIRSLSGHHIICGFGRVGRQVARDLRAARATYLIVDPDPENRARAEALEIPFIEGDATDDGVLGEAGIERARSIIVCADSDANNVFITLTARELRADILIVARAGIEDTEKKLIRAGADRVISPYKSSGTEMARLALHRQLSGVVDVDLQYRLEEIEVGRHCGALGRTIEDIRGGTIILALRRAEEFVPQPAGTTVMLEGDVLIAIGSPQALARLESQLEEPAHERAPRDGAPR